MITKLIHNIKLSSDNFGSLPFWSWNDKLEEKELVRQIENMKSIGMKGFFMHARGGLATEYLSDDWFEAVKVCVKKAKELDMQAWLYDENGWPSGFAGRKLLNNKKNLTSYLKLSYDNEYPTDNAFSLWDDGVIAVYQMINNIPIRIFSKVEGLDKYIVVRRKFEGSYVDTLNRKITDEFLRLTYDEYLVHFKNELGSENMPGFFTDEPQYFRYATVWSSVIPDEFSKSYNYDVYDMLPSLFMDYKGAREARYDYWLLCQRLFIENWIKPVYDWCEKNGCQLTGHAIEESRLSAQMWCCGGVMPFYEYEHIPGIDHLGRNIDSGLEAKQVGSVAAQLGKKRVLSEMFACCGCDVTPKELKRIAESQFVDGVNLICQHLYPYSLRGERKYDHPAHYSENLPWQDDLADFNEYFNRLSCLLCEGEEVVDTLLIHPMHSCYLDYKRDMDYESIEPIEVGILEAMSVLNTRQIPFHFGDEIIMSKYARVSGNKLIVGKCEYSTIVLPLIYTLDSKTYKLINEYLSGGGKLLLLDNSPDRIDGKKVDFSLSSNITLKEIYNNAVIKLSSEKYDTSEIRCMIRQDKTEKIVYLFNRSNITLKNVKVTGMKNPKMLDLNTLEAKSCTVSGNDVLLDFEAVGSFILIDDNTEININNKTFIKTGLLQLKNEFELKEKPQNSFLLDKAKISFDGINYEKRRPIELIRQLLLDKRYEGTVYLKFNFSLLERIENIFAVAEPLKSSIITLNGNKLNSTDAWWFDRNFLTYDIKDCIKIGENELIMEFDYFQRQEVYDIFFGKGNESLRNCLTFDTEPERVFLYGDFTVETDKALFYPVADHSFCYEGEFSLKNQEKTVQADNLSLNGYPFFSGQIKILQNFECINFSNARLCLDGRFAVCKVYINNKFVKTLMFEDNCDISEFLNKGNNTLELLISSAYRNLIGPHHYIDEEPIHVFPRCFTFENDWVNEECKNYKSEYSFVKFGLKATIEFGE